MWPFVLGLQLRPLLAPIEGYNVSALLNLWSRIPRHIVHTRTRRGPALAFAGTADHSPGSTPQHNGSG
eukprot:m.233544 g.233544  ORF g.233544 m.233544 type:complete len:68 (-) comp19295_c0_seq13:1982-2185(-)